MARRAVLPDGFRYRDDLLTVTEERELVAVIRDMTFEEVVFQGHLAKRTVRHFGYGYDFTSRAVSHGDPLPLELDDVHRRAAEFAGIDRERLVETLVTRYPAGAGIGWHRDAPSFGDVVGVSLGSPCMFRFRRKTDDGFEHVRVEVVPGSAYVLSGAARWTWQHSIPPVDEERYSITFRTLRERDT